MASLAGAITFLTLAGAPGLAPWSQVVEEGSGSRPNDGTFTQLQPAGVSGARYGSFTDKTEETASTKVVTDSIRIFLTEGPVADIDIDVNDTITVRITDTAYAGLSRSVSDTITLRSAESVFSLAKSGTIPKTVSDTITLRITEGVAYGVAISVSDTLTPVLTESNSVDKSDVKTVSDTITLVLANELPLLSIFAANVSLGVTDTLRLAVSESSGLKASGEVDRISIKATPKGRIRIVRE